MSRRGFTLTASALAILMAGVAYVTFKGGEPVAGALALSVLCYISHALRVTLAN